ncbi:MAG: aspartyl/asparaginyl beta-hydroxylase domain-containing protein [Bacteroidia bacterium]|nr:aspartyl/asparaginyl beta-hydroxylase domain-containing protein [Bacteroidia bacterium]
MKTLWFSIYDRDAYKGDEPTFYNEKDFAWAEKLKPHLAEIRTELEEHLKKAGLITYFNSAMTEKAGVWKTISMKWWGLEVYKHQNYFKRTTELINQIPGIVSASFNMLDADAVIKPHNGDTNGIYRCHFGLVVPGTLPECGFRVETEKRSWHEGEWLIFVDALNHEAWNKTNKPRYIMVVDVIRPEFQNRKSTICSTVLTSLFMQKLGERFKFLHNTSLGFQIKLVKMLRPFSFPAMWARNLASWLGIVD